jgi:signal peptide peptidase SppA
MQSDLSEMPSSFRAALEAALARPAALDPRHVENVRALRGLRPRGDHPRASSAVAAFDTPHSMATPGVAVVDVSGPLSQRAWSCWMWEGDGYDAIRLRMSRALGDPNVRSIVLRIDSPGGEVAGLNEAVRAMRAEASAAGKPVVVYVDELAASAAYAIATVGDEIVTPESGCLGSIGVILAITKRDRANEAAGLSTFVVTSGARKADGHPFVAATKEEIAAFQSEVDALAQMFGALVAERRGGDAARWLGLEAACFYGNEAVANGLADRVGGFEVAVQRAQELAAEKRSAGRVPAKRGEKTMSKLMTIAAIMGLAVDTTASEDELAAQISAEAHKREAARRELLKITGAEDDESALGTVKGWKVGASHAAELEATVKRLAEEQERAEREQLIKSMRASGQLSAAMEAELVPTMSLPQLRAFAKTAQPIVPVGKKHTEPTTPTVGATGGRVVGPDGRTYEQLSNAERKALQRDNPELFKAMREDAQSGR